MAAPVEPRLRFRPASRLTPELVEGLRRHKAAILERLEGSDQLPVTVPRTGELLLNNAVIQDAGEVLKLARAVLNPKGVVYDPPPPPKVAPGRDPLTHHHTGKARFFGGVRERDLEKRRREGLPPRIRLVEGGAA